MPVPNTPSVALVTGASRGLGAADLAGTPVRRVGTPDDVAAVVAFLASESAGLSPASESPSTAVARSPDVEG
ncbi:hypothetical protein AB0B45_14390 [Nonomuraea sp. NPDC049152]|uniref:hypothetical protein n=1 Tax=Nonomuraea sp. NPDC049152 TaxID=3154350 RepID=UPI0033D118B7